MFPKSCTDRGELNKEKTSLIQPKKFTVDEIEIKGEYDKNR